MNVCSRRKNQIIIRCLHLTFCLMMRRVNLQSQVLVLMTSSMEEVRNSSLLILIRKLNLGNHLLYNIQQPIMSLNHKHQDKLRRSIWRKRKRQIIIIIKRGTWRPAKGQSLVQQRRPCTVKVPSMVDPCTHNRPTL